MENKKYYLQFKVIDVNSLITKNHIIKATSDYLNSFMLFLIKYNLNFDLTTSNKSKRLTFYCNNKDYDYLKNTTDNFRKMYNYKVIKENE